MRKIKKKKRAKVVKQKYVYDVIGDVDARIAKQQKRHIFCPVQVQSVKFIFEKRKLQFITTKFIQFTIE